MRHSDKEETPQMAQEVANTLAKCSTLVHPGSDVRTLEPRGASTAQGVTRSIIKEDLGSGSSLSTEVQYETVIQGTWSKDNGNNLPEAAEFITEANLGGGVRAPGARPERFGRFSVFALLISRG